MYSSCSFSLFSDLIMQDYIKPKLGVAYTRVSSGSQLDGWWLNSQLTNCERHCPIIWWKIIESFEDWWVSWWDLERPWIKRMFDFIDKYNRNNVEKITFIIADNADRIARDVNVHWALKLDMTKRNLELITVNQKFENTPQWHFIETMMAANAQLFREENKHRVITRQEARLMDWYRPFNYPIWYKTAKAPDGWKLLIKDDPDASIIKEALESYADWVLNSVEEVANFLERKWLKFTRCQNKRKKHDLNTVHVSTTGRILNNILYAWYIEYKKTTRYRKWPQKWLVKNGWNVSLRKGKHEGIISLETYYKIQERMGKKRFHKTPLKKVNEDFPLRWFLYCDCCNRPLSSWITRKKRKEWKSIPYYSFNKKCICSWKSVNAERIHKQFDDVVKNLKMDDRTIAFLKELLLEEYNTRQKDKLLVVKNIEKEFMNIDEQVKNAINAITASSSEIVRKKLEGKVEELELRRQTLQRQSHVDTSMHIENVMAVAFEILRDPYYVWANGNVDEKRMFYQLVFRNNLQVNKKSESFWTLPISALFLLNHQVFGTEFLVGGDGGSRTHV